MELVILRLVFHKMSKMY